VPHCLYLFVQLTISAQTFSERCSVLVIRVLELFYARCEGVEGSGSGSGRGSGNGIGHVDVRL
jgi:hypothetical protein